LREVRGRFGGGTIYNADYFIAKFTAIPEDLWCEQAYSRGIQHCALGHCGMDVGRSTAESRGLNRLFDDEGLDAPKINDGIEAQFHEPTPKRRILSALQWIKERKK
jgi:hypothetical protein